MIDPQLLEMLRCPQDQSPIRLADAALVERINRAVAAGTLRNLGGKPVKKPLDGALMREAGDLVYPLQDAIPVMLPDEAISLAALEGE